MKHPLFAMMVQKTLVTSPEDLCVTRCQQKPIDFASIEGEEAAIRISVQAPDGTRWQVEVSAGCGYRSLR